MEGAISLAVEHDKWASRFFRCRKLSLYGIDLGRKQVI